MNMVFCVFCLAGLILSAPAFASDDISRGQQIIEFCWDKGGDHVSKVMCEETSLNMLKKKMKEIYDTRIKEAQKSDREMKEEGSLAFVDTEQSVVKSQKAFDAYMKEECDRQVAYVMGGSFGADTDIGCKINLISERIAVLNKAKQ